MFSKKYDRKARGPDEDGLHHNGGSGNADNPLGDETHVSAKQGTDESVRHEPEDPLYRPLLHPGAHLVENHGEKDGHAIHQGGDDVWVDAAKRFLVKRARNRN